MDVFDGQVLHCSTGDKNADTRDECQPLARSARFAETKAYERDTLDSTRKTLLTYLSFVKAGPKRLC